MMEVRIKISPVVIEGTTGGSTSTIGGIGTVVSFEGTVSGSGVTCVWLLFVFVVLAVEEEDLAVLGNLLEKSLLHSLILVDFAGD